MTAPLTRRFFLRGAGGAWLALPVLPSLLSPAQARAQAASGARCLVGITTEHGGVWGSNMYPTDATQTDALTYAGRTVRRGTLQSAVSGGRASLSSVLSADSGVFSAALLAKMNVIRGIDIPFNIAHHRAGMWGNTSFNSGSNSDALAAQQWPRPTIDHVLGWSPAFYSSAELAAVKARVLNIYGAWPGAVNKADNSYIWANPSTRSGPIQAASGSDNSLYNFTNLFGSPGTAPPTARRSIITRVKESYDRLRRDTRLSSDDRRRLDEHFARVAELERRINAATPPTCGAVTRPARGSLDVYNAAGAGYGSNPQAHIEFFQLNVDVMVLALSCGLTRVAMLGLSGWSSFSEVPGNDDIFHQSVAHQVHSGQGQPAMVAASQRIFEKVVLYAAAKLNGVSMGDGSTLLDRTLLAWTQEAGNVIHGGLSIPIVTFGGAGGSLKTGQYVDYRNKALNIAPSATGELGQQFYGLLVHQWLGTVLQAMGIARAEYQEPDHGGYGKLFVKAGGDYGAGAHSTAVAYPASVVTACSDMLPFLRP